MSLLPPMMGHSAPWMVALTGKKSRQCQIGLSWLQDGPNALVVKPDNMPPFGMHLFSLPMMASAGPSFWCPNRIRWEAIFKYLGPMYMPKGLSARAPTEPRTLGNIGSLFQRRNLISSPMLGNCTEAWAKHYWSRPMADLIGTRFRSCRCLSNFKSNHQRKSY
jgi:hypothetical protein